MAGLALNPGSCQGSQLCQRAEHWPTQAAEHARCYNSAALSKSVAHVLDPGRCSEQLKMVPDRQGCNLVEVEELIGSTSVCSSWTPEYKWSSDAHV